MKSYYLTKHNLAQLKIVVHEAVVAYVASVWKRLTEGTWSLNGYHIRSTLIFLTPSRMLLVTTNISGSKGQEIMRFWYWKG